MIITQAQQISIICSNYILTSNFKIIINNSEASFLHNSDSVHNISLNWSTYKVLLKLVIFSYAYILYMWYTHGACTSENASKPPGVVVPEICELLNVVDGN